MNTENDGLNSGKTIDIMKDQQVNLQGSANTDKGNLVKNFQTLNLEKLLSASPECILN